MKVNYEGLSDQDLTVSQCDCINRENSGLIDKVAVRESSNVNTHYDNRHFFLSVLACSGIQGLTQPAQLCCQQIC